MKRANLIGSVLLLAIATPVYGTVSAEPPAVPAEILQRATEYIDGQVGAAYRAQNFEPVAEECTAEHGIVVDSCKAAAAAPNVRAYTLAYRYLPWVRLGALAPVVHIRIPTSPSQNVTGYVGTLDSSGRVVEPTVTKGDAEAKMHSAIPDSGLLSPATLLVPGETPGSRPSPVWFGYFPVGEPGGSCWVTRPVRVDAITGAVTVEPDSTACE